MSLLLTKPFTDESRPYDEYIGFGVLKERVLREIAWRKTLEEPVVQVRLAEVVPARDAGDVCHECGQIVSWVDHLPPVVGEGGPVRCFAKVRQITAARSQRLLPAITQDGEFDRRVPS